MERMNISGHGAIVVLDVALYSIPEDEPWRITQTSHTVRFEGVHLSGKNARYNNDLMRLYAREWMEEFHPEAYNVQIQHMKVERYNHEPVHRIVEGDL